MAYTVIVAAPAARDLRKLPEDARRRIGRRIDALAGDPRPHGVRQLKGLPELYRVRIGEYRAIYQIQDRELLVLVVQVRHRREVYR